MKFYFISYRKLLASIAAGVFIVNFGFKDAPLLAQEISASEWSPAVMTLKLSDLIEEALARNPEIRVFEERWKQAKARVWQEMSWDDTMIGADFEGIPRGRIDADRNSDIEWMISQKIPFPGKRFLAGRVASHEAKMAEQDFRAKERDVIHEVKRAYFDYFFKEHEILVHQETQKILGRLAKAAESRYGTGQTSYSEVLRFHMELAILTNEIALHLQERETAKAMLNMLLGRDAREPIEIEIGLTDHRPTYTRDELMALALEHRPELRALHHGLSAAGTDAKKAWLDLLPDGVVRLEARQFPGEGKIREYDQFYGFEVPVFSLLGRAGKIKEAKAEKRAAEQAVEGMENRTLFEIQKSLAAFESNDRTVKTYESQMIPQAEAVQESALADYEGGRGNFTTVLEAQKTLMEYRHHYFESLAMREQSFADLERAVGIDLGGGLTL